MFKIITKYLMTSFIPPFLISVIFFVSFLLTFQLFKVIGLVIKKDVDLIVIFSIISDITMSFLPMAIPLSALFATIFILNKLSEDSEIVAIRSFGITKWGIFKPFLIIGILLALLSFGLRRTITPYANKRFRNTILKLAAKGLMADIKEGQFFTDLPGVILFSEKVRNKGKELENVFIRTINRNTGEERVIVAKKGLLTKKSIKTGGLGSIRLKLSDGNILKTIESGSNTEKIIFEKYDFPIVTGQVASDYITKDSMRTSQELILMVKQGKDKMHMDAKRFTKLKLELYERMSTPFQTLLFIFLGFGLGIKQGRGRGRSTGPTVLAILLIYYTIFFTGIAFAGKLLLSPELAIVIPLIIAFIAGIYFYYKLDWSN